MQIPPPSAPLRAGMTILNECLRPECYSYRSASAGKIRAADHEG